MNDNIKNTKVKVSEYSAAANLCMLNDTLKGKTIKRLFDADDVRVMVEFDDGEVGMIEAMESEGGEKFLSVIPPNDCSRDFLSNVIGMARR